MISLKITVLTSENQGQGQTVTIELKSDVTLLQARNLAKLIKQKAETDLKVALDTSEEIVEIK